MPPATPKACPCGSNLLFAACCEPVIAQHAAAKTALQLMRSRYSAFALGLVDYILNTTHPDKPEQGSFESIKHFCDITDFKGLEILSAEGDQVIFHAQLITMSNGTP